MQWMSDELKNVVKYYDIFCQVAERLEWIEIREQHENWFKVYPFGIQLDLYEFPQGYIQDYIACAYVRACLSGMAFHEEWDRNFWDIPQTVRKYCLTNGRTAYASYAIFEEVRFIEQDWHHIVREIELFAGKNGISASEQRRFTERFENAEVVELGGYYGGDATYLAVKQNLMLVVSCGFWD